MSDKKDLENKNIVTEKNRTAEDEGKPTRNTVLRYHYLKKFISRNLVFVRYYTNLLLFLSKLQNYVIDPSEDIYYKWLILVSVAVLYNYLFIIGRASFELLQNYNPFMWFVLDCISDFIYLMDIFVRLRTGNHSQFTIGVNLSCYMCLL